MTVSSIAENGQYLTFSLDAKGFALEITRLREIFEIDWAFSAKKLSMATRAGVSREEAVDGADTAA